MFDDDVESEKQDDMWRKKATTTVRYELCNKCEYYVPQKPYLPGIRCKFGLRPKVRFKDSLGSAECNVYKEKS